MEEVRGAFGGDDGEEAAKGVLAGNAVRLLGLDLSGTG